MTLEELEDLAYRREPMPESRSQADILAYQSFRKLYEFAERVRMDPAQGRREKSEIISAHKRNKFLEELQEQTQQMWARIEIAVAEYNKSPSIENADKLIKAIYRVERKQL